MSLTKVVRKEDKLLIKRQKSEQVSFEDVILAEKDFNAEPEKVDVSIGVTISPQEYESIKINYSCQINHQPGQQYRDDAFEVAKFNCLERLTEDVVDLHQSGIIDGHYLIKKEVSNPDEDKWDDAQKEKEAKKKAKKKKKTTKKKAAKKKKAVNPEKQKANEQKVQKIVAKVKKVKVKKPEEDTQE